VIVLIKAEISNLLVQVCTWLMYVCLISTKGVSISIVLLLWDCQFLSRNYTIDCQFLSINYMMDCQFLSINYMMDCQFLSRNYTIDCQFLSRNYTSLNNSKPYNIFSTKFRYRFTAIITIAKLTTLSITNDKSTVIF